MSKHVPKSQTGFRSKRPFGSKKKKENESDDNINVWFCPHYQRNKCQNKSSHFLVIKGKARNAQHICATCWQKDKKKLAHPECSSACPHTA